MLDLKTIIAQPTEIKAKLLLRGFNKPVIDELVKLAATRSKVMTEIQTLESKRNKLSKEIGAVKATKGDITPILKEVASVKKEIEKINEQEVNVNKEVNELLLTLPNIPSDTTPVGATEDDNVVLKEYNFGTKKTKVKPHHEIATDLELVDFKRAVKMAGARFWAYTGMGARMVRALESLMLDTHTAKGYLEVIPPLLVNSKTMQGTGQLPKFGDDLFRIEGLDSWLIPTAEVPLTNFHANEIVDLTKPIMLTAYTPCFRKEAGSGGKDMKGTIRGHQFNKVELVKLVSKEQATEEFNKTVEDARHILDLLELPHRALHLVTGDIGFSASETIDLEVWIPSENKYREISSVSYFGDFQGRRASIRYKDEEGNMNIAHTINGSSLAIDRAMAAIFENYQNEDGSINVPKALHKYMGVKVIKNVK